MPNPSRSRNALEERTLPDARTMFAAATTAQALQIEALPKLTKPQAAALHEIARGKTTTAQTTTLRKLAAFGLVTLDPARLTGLGMRYVRTTTTKAAHR